MQSIAIIIGKTIDYAVTVGISSARFDNVINAIAVRIQVQIIRRAVTISVLGCCRISNTISIAVYGSCNRIDIVGIVNAIAIAIYTANWCFNTVADTVIVRICIDEVRDTVTV